MLSKKILFIGAALLSLSACETIDGVVGDFKQTQFVSAFAESDKEVEYVKVPVPVAKPYFKKLPDISKHMVKAKRVNPDVAIKDARKASLQKSTPDGFINAMQVFDYMPGALYEIYASPGYITSIVLKPGEELISKTAGDTVRWIMGETATGSGRDRRTVLVVKPLKPNLSTNMMITTDQRIYMIESKSVKGGVYNASVTWNYPHDDFKDMKQRAVSSAIKEEQVVAGNINLHDLNYDFSIETTKGSEPDWKPIEAFDDGLKTYIRFANNLGTTKAPVLYILSEEGKAEIVNYRVRGNFYVIDRLINVAELRIGTKSPKIVRITRQKSKSFFGRMLDGSSYGSNRGLNG